MIEDEMKAIRRVTAALEALPERARSRVMRYVFDSEADRGLPQVAFDNPPVGTRIGGTRMKVKDPEPSLDELGEVPRMQCREPDLDHDAD